MNDKYPPAATDQGDLDKEGRPGNNQAGKMELFEELVPLISYMHQQENVLRELMRRIGPAE